MIPKISTEQHGRETVRYRGPKTWNMLPNDIKDSESLSIFRNKIKKWKPTGCTCKLCLEFRTGIGYGIMKDGVFVLKEACV